MFKTLNANAINKCCFQLFRTRSGLMTMVAGEFSFPARAGVFGVFGVRGVFKVILLNERFIFSGVRSLTEWILSFSSVMVDSFSLFASCKWIIFCGQWILLVINSAHLIHSEGITFTYRFQLFVLFFEIFNLLTAWLLVSELLILFHRFVGKLFDVLDFVL